MQERFIGAMLGLACGDALGAPAEFKSKGQVRQEFGVLRDMVGGGMWKPGEWTDDTGMALCVAGGILAAPNDPIMETGKRFLEWQKTAKDVGNTISAALNAFKGDWPEAAKNTPQAKSGKAAGNGSLMRILPVALAYPYTATMLRRSARLSAMTHWDAQAETCCAIYCLWVQGILQGDSLKTAWNSALWQARHLAENLAPTSQTPGMSAAGDPLWQRLGNVESLKYENLQPSGYAGYVVECLEAAAWCVLYSGSLERTLIQAVNLAGESDTIAAVAGGAAGAFYGANAIPSRWIDKLHQAALPEYTSFELYRLRHKLTYAKIVERSGQAKPFEYNEVVEGIFAGRHPLTARDIETLRNEKITHILDLREPAEWEAPRLTGREALEAAKMSGIVRKHLPVTDMGAPDETVFDAAWDYLEACSAQPNSRVYIHCRAGLERTASVLTACYAQKQGISYEDALKTLQKARPAFHPLPNQEKAARAWLEKQQK